MKQASASVLITVLIFAFVAPVTCTEASETIIVPDDFLSMQEALNAAKLGDTIYVKAGTYQGEIKVYTNGLRLVGEDRNN